MRGRPASIVRISAMMTFVRSMFSIRRWKSSEVVIDYTRIGSLTFYDMGEQAGTAKEVDESRRGGELL